MPGRLTMLIAGVVVATGCSQAPTTVDPLYPGEAGAPAGGDVGSMTTLQRHGGRHGFHRGGFHRGGFHRGGFHRGGFHRGHFGRHRFHRFDRFGFGYPNFYGSYAGLLGLNYALPYSYGYAYNPYDYLYNPYDYLYTPYSTIYSTVTYPLYL